MIGDKAMEYGIDELMYSDEYADFIMSNGDGTRLICNGDMLIEAMESGYLFEEFLDSIGLEVT